jgi:hypothetical protein
MLIQFSPRLSSERTVKLNADAPWRAVDTLWPKKKPKLPEIMANL